MNKLNSIAAIMCSRARSGILACPRKPDAPFCQPCTDAARNAVAIISVPNETMIVAGTHDVPKPLKVAARDGVSRVWQLMCNAVLAGA